MTYLEYKFLGFVLEGKQLYTPESDFESLKGGKESKFKGSSLCDFDNSQNFADSVCLKERYRMDLIGFITKAYKETRRILRLTRKPKRTELYETAKITGLGMILVGLIGFIILLLSHVLT